MPKNQLMKNKKERKEITKRWYYYTHKSNNWVTSTRRKLSKISEINFKIDKNNSTKEKINYLKNDKDKEYIEYEYSTKKNNDSFILTIVEKDDKKEEKKYNSYSIIKEEEISIKVEKEEETIKR